MRATFTILVMALLLSCSKSDPPKPVYSFTNQDVAGKIENVAWTYADGFAQTSTGTDPRLSVNLFLTQSKKGCAVTSSITGDQVFFGLPAKVGLYTLSFNLQGGSSYTATLFQKSTTTNIIASEGAIEILTITATEVTGRMDARSDDKNFVNGNFRVAVCP
jgi:hypothetical protein